MYDSVILFACTNAEIVTVREITIIALKTVATTIEVND